MRYEDRLDSLIQFHAARLWPEADWRLIKAQVATESGFRPLAVSPCGAVGLLQLMPATFAELTQAGHITDCDDNLAAGIRYLRRQFEHFPEIPDEAERLKFALAAYNGGRGYVNRALELARRAEGIDDQRLPSASAAPAGNARRGTGPLSGAQAAPAVPGAGAGCGNFPPGRWQTWETARTYLAVEGCRVNGRRPDYRQMWDYVERVMRRWAALRQGGAA